MAKVAYREHFVAYIDIMGFKDIVSHLDPADIVRFRERLRKGIRNSGIDLRSSTTRVKMFSDCLTMSAPMDEYRLPLFLIAIGRFEAEMARLGFFLRGAVTSGEHYEDDRLLFGPALIEAVEAERTLAVWPRIVVHPRLAGREPADNPVRSDSDCVTYIDYLGIGSSESGTGLVKKHRQHIVDQIGEAAGRGEYRVLAKYWWLATYHNSHVESMGLARDLQVDMALLGPGMPVPKS